MHLIKVFLIYYFDSEKQEQKKRTWKMKNITPANKIKFLTEIKEYTRSKSNLYWKGYCKVKAFENLDLAEQLDENNPESVPY